MKNNVIEVQDIKITITNLNEKDYICISDIAKAKSDNSRAADVIRNWLRNRSKLVYYHKDISFNCIFSFSANNSRVYCKLCFI